MKCSANRVRSLYLRKTRLAKQRNTAEFVRLELQISRSEPTELCRRFPRRKLFSAVDQEFVMTHFGRRWRRCLHARIHEGRCFSGAGTQAITQRSEEHTSELQSQSNLVCRLLLEKTKAHQYQSTVTR